MIEGRPGSAGALLSVGGIGRTPAASGLRGDPRVRIPQRVQYSRTMSSRPRYALFALAFTLATVIGCGTSYEEISRIPSPDGRVDAILVRASGGGATVGFTFNVFIVPRGRSPVQGEERFVADHPKDLKVRWRAPRKLEIVYDEARIFQFRNFWHSKEVDDFKYLVELQLSPTGSSQLPSPRESAAYTLSPLEHDINTNDTRRYDRSRASSPPGPPQNTAASRSCSGDGSGSLKAG